MQLRGELLGKVWLSVCIARVSKANTKHVILTCACFADMMLAIFACYFVMDVNVSVHVYGWLSVFCVDADYRSMQCCVL